MAPTLYLSNILRRTKQENQGRLNPALYCDTASSSSFTAPPLGWVHLSCNWRGPQQDQLNIRIIKIKNILEEFYGTGLYFRWQRKEW